MLFSVEQAFVGREEIRAPLKTPAWEATTIKHLIQKASFALHRPHSVLAIPLWFCCSIWLELVDAPLVGFSQHEVGLFLASEGSV